MLKSHSYIVIGYFPSETSITGTPLVVLWRAESKSGTSILSLFVQDLEQHLSQMPPEPRDWVVRLFDSVRGVPADSPELINALLDRLSNLSVGPIRTMAHGSIDCDENGDHMKDFGAAMRLITAWKPSHKCLTTMSL